MAKQSSPTRWSNRIVGYGTDAPDQLLANPEQWKIHPKTQQDSLDSILSKVGWVQNVVVNRTTGHVVDGHARIGLAIAKGEKEIPITYVELTQEEESLVLAVLDPLASLAAIDRAKWDEIVADLATSDPGIAEVIERLTPDFGMLGTSIKGEDVDMSDLDKELEDLADTSDESIIITVPMKDVEQVKEWLANGEKVTAAGMGKGVLKRCGLLS